MEKVMEVFKSMDIRYIYVIVGIVVVLLILNLIWVLFLRKRGPSAEEVKNAEMALSEAKQKEADLYAPDEYQRAEDSLAKATHLLATKEYRKAKKALEVNIEKEGCCLPFLGGISRQHRRKWIKLN